MSNPVFIHVMANGDIWTSNDQQFSPAGTMAACFRINSDARSQKLGTISGVSPTYATSGSTGKQGKEIV